MYIMWYIKVLQNSAFVRYINTLYSAFACYLRFFPRMAKLSSLPIIAHQSLVFVVFKHFTKFHLNFPGNVLACVSSQFTNIAFEYFWTF